MQREGWVDEWNEMNKPMNKHGSFFTEVCRSHLHFIVGKSKVHSSFLLSDTVTPFYFIAFLQLLEIHRFPAPWQLCCDCALFCSCPAVHVKTSLETIFIFAAGM